MTDQNYNVEQEIAAFFSTKTRVLRNSCDEFAKKLIVEKSTSGNTSTSTSTSTNTVRLEIVPTQGVCSYTVYAGTSNNSNSSTLDWVVQFRLKSLALPMETMERAKRVYGGLVPEVSFRGEMGDANGGDGNGNDDGRENLVVYVMPRMRGISRLEYILAHGFPEDGEKICEARERLVGDVAS